METSKILKSSQFNIVEDLYFGTAERSIQESSRVRKSQLKPYNQDDLWQKTGNYKIYEDMLNDDQVDVAMQLKVDMVLSDGFTFQLEDDSQEEIKKDLECALNEDPDCDFMECLEDLIRNSYSFGFALAEKIFKRRSDGSLTFRNLKTRHPDTFLLHQDKQGNLTDIEQFGVTNSIFLDPDSMIHLINRPMFQNPYGTSDLRSAHDAWITKRHIIRYYAIFLEKHASPFPVARYDQNVPETVVDEIHKAIKNLQNRTALTVPKELELELIQANSQGEAYVKGINIFNMFIGRALFVPDLLGFQGSETSGGSFSLGQKQFEIFFKHILRRRNKLESLVNQHIIKPLVVFNYGLQDSFPTFKLNPISEENVTELVKLWIEAQRSAIYEPSDDEINFFRNIIKFPEGEVERKEPPQPGLPFPPQQPPGQEEPANEPEDDDSPSLRELPDIELVENRQDDKRQNKQEFAVFKKPPFDFQKKVNFQALGASLDNAKETVIAEIQPILNESFSDLFDQISRKKIVERNAIEKAESLKLKNLKKINSIFKNSFRNRFKEAGQIAQSEILKQSFRAPLPDDEFLGFLEKETFRFVGEWEFSVLRTAKDELIKAIRDGAPLSSVLDELDFQGKQSATVSLERFARTKFTDVVNRGRLASFNESGVVAGYQYSAILDGRVSDICGGLHGKIFRAGKEPIPPLHFNCRAVLVPITRFEEFSEDSRVGGMVETTRGDSVRIKNQSIDDHIKEFLGKGFSRR